MGFHRFGIVVFAAPLLQALGVFVTLAACTEPTIGTDSPRVIASSPSEASVSVSPTVQVRITFSAPMDSASVVSAISAREVELGGKIRGTTVYVAKDRMASWTPTSPVGGLTHVVVNVSSAARSTDGHALAPFFVTFTIRETNPPSVVGFTPRDGSRDVPLETLETQPTIDFDEGIGNAYAIRWVDSASQSPVGFFIDDPGPPNRIRLRPYTALKSFQTYTVIIGDDVTDVAGNALANPTKFSFQFREYELPRVTSTTPTDRAENVPRSTHIQILLDHGILPVTARTTQLTVKRNGEIMTSYLLEYAYWDTKLDVLGPALAANSDYTLSFDESFTDSKGVSQSNSYSWTFRTGS